MAIKKKQIEKEKIWHLHFLTIRDRIASVYIVYSGGGSGGGPIGANKSLFSLHCFLFFSFFF